MNSFRILSNMKTSVLQRKQRKYILKRKQSVLHSVSKFYNVKVTTWDMYLYKQLPI